MDPHRCRPCWEGAHDANNTLLCGERSPGRWRVSAPSGNAAHSPGYDECTLNVMPSAEPQPRLLSRQCQTRTPAGEHDTQVMSDARHALHHRSHGAVSRGCVAETSRVPPIASSLPWVKAWMGRARARGGAPTHSRTRTELTDGHRLRQCEGHVHPLLRHRLLVLQQLLDAQLLHAQAGGTAACLLSAPIPAAQRHASCEHRPEDAGMRGAGAALARHLLCLSARRLVSTVCTQAHPGPRCTEIRSVSLCLEWGARAFLVRCPGGEIIVIHGRPMRR